MLSKVEMQKQTNNSLIIRDELGGAEQESAGTKGQKEM